MLLEGLRSDLAAAGVAAKVVYSGGIDVDVLAQVGLPAHLLLNVMYIIALR
jgi:hypothetical protein